MALFKLHRPLKHIAIIMLPLFLAVMASGCGYTFTGAGSILPPDVKRVYIPLTENNSTELGLSDVVTEALREQFDSYGVVTVVDSQNQADAVLRTTVLSVKRTTRSTTSSTDAALQLDTKLTISAELVRVTGPVLWRDGEISVSKSFGGDRNVVITSSADFASGSIGAEDIATLDPREVARGQEQEVLATLAEDAARKIYDDAVAPDF